MSQIADELFDSGEITAAQRTKLLRETGSNLAAAMLKGYGVDLENFDWTTPDGAMLARLTKDVWQFSAAKNYHELGQKTFRFKK